MTYFNKNAELKQGYNAYIDASVDDMGTQMDVGLLVMEEGDTFIFEEAQKEIAVLLFAGKVTCRWNGEAVEAERPDCFRHEAYCLLASRGTRVELTAHGRSELYIQKTINQRDYTPVMFTPETIQTQHAGSNGELLGCMQREIKTFFDYDNAPFSNMVLGEVLNDRGNWSGYLPHRHPQPETYLFKFDRPEGFGASFVGDQVFKSVNNSFSAIPGGELHPQAVAPGFQMYTCWMIRHLEGNPWLQTDRCEDEKYVWMHDAEF